MDVNSSIHATMNVIKGSETKDQSVKNIFSYKPIMGNILKYTVEEYKDCSLEKIMECIEGDTIQTGTALIEEDMAKSIRGEKTEANTADESAATFDILFRSLLPNTTGNILVNLHVDFEFQNNYMPGYPIIKRGVYYASRKLSAQLDKIGKNGEGYKNLEKVYSIWICLDKIPKDLQNTVSYYRMQNYKNEGLSVPDMKVNSEEADLLEVVIVRLGKDTSAETGLMDFLYGIFSGDNQKVLSYIPDSGNVSRQKEVFEMLSLISNAEKNGEKKAENRLRKLISLLYKEHKTDDIERIANDEEYLEKLYKEYKL